MDQLPPPPPPRPDLSAWGGPTAPARSRRTRPQPVTAAAVILIVLGALGAIAGVALLVMRPQDLASVGDMGGLDIGRVGRRLGALSAILGGLQVVVGMLVLRLSNVGRILAIVLSALGAFGSLSRGAGTGLIALGLDAFVLYALIAYRSAFRRAPGR